MHKPYITIHTRTQAIDRAQCKTSHAAVAISVPWTSRAPGDRQRRAKLAATQAPRRDPITKMRIRLTSSMASCDETSPGQQLLLPGKGKKSVAHVSSAAHSTVSWALK